MKTTESISDASTSDIFRSRRRGLLQVAKPRRIVCDSLMLVVLGLFAVMGRLQAMSMKDIAMDGLSLSLSAGPSSANEMDVAKSDDDHDSLAIMSRIMNDDCNDEFSLTMQALEFVDNSLQQFAMANHLEPSRAAEGNFISGWLTTLAAGQPVQPDQLVVHQAGELDFIYTNFWNQFKLYIHRLIVERPPDLNNLDLAFRCERYKELTGLLEMSQVSTIYRVILDIFSSEFYTHCLTRKLAIIKLQQIRPSSILQQFVDIYLDMPTQNALIKSRSRALKIKEEKMKAGLALNFNLQQSMAQHGPLESAAELVFDANSALSMGLGRPSASDLVQRFKSDCQDHSKQLVKIWGNFDELAAYLSSPMNNLAAFNARIKNAAPQLVYGALCGQLAQTSA